MRTYSVLVEPSEAFLAAEFQQGLENFALQLFQCSSER